MLSYYIRLALKSFGRNRGLTALMIGTIALGISACVVMLTVYHAMSGNPIWWKNDRLYAVTIDNWDPGRPADPRYPELPPTQLSYRDAGYLAASNIPEHAVVMFKARGVVTGGVTKHAPLPVITRVTTADFFTMFDVPFLFGGGWNKRADRGPEPVIVLSKEENERLFGGVNSVGHTVRWNDHEFRVIGVLDSWMPLPKFYDINNDPLEAPEDLYIPYGWTEALELLSGGNNSCWRGDTLKSYREYLNSDCIWQQMWVEIPSARGVEHMQALLHSYWLQQRQSGRFPRPENNRLTRVDQWLKDHHVVQSDDRILVGLALAFFAVCLINTVGLLLAKFLNGAPISGVRRALGASRRDVFTQHLVEAAMLAAAGAALGLLLSALELWGLRAMDAATQVHPDGGYQQLAHVDFISVVATVGLAIVATLCAGFYPAWRIGRLLPAVYLKSQ